MYSVGAVYSTVYWGIFFCDNNIYNGISYKYFYKSFITVDHPWSAFLNLSSTGIASQMLGITPIKLLLNKFKQLNCMVKESDDVSLVRLLNLYEWVAGLTNLSKIVAAAHIYKDPIICIEFQQH